jgi:hypothetical protein
MDQAMIEHLSPLIGRTIKGIVKDDSDPTMETVYGLELDDGTELFILCDPEGNGPGHLSIQKG